jgi:hypothetical protein
MLEEGTPCRWTICLQCSFQFALMILLSIKDCRGKGVLYINESLVYLPRTVFLI